MTPRSTGRVALLAAGLCCMPAWSADDPAQSWLMRISKAARDLNYDGTFVYQQGEQLEAMRVIHRVKDRSTQERLVSLNGSPREIIRNDRVVWCYLPDEKRVVVEHRRAEAKQFPSLLPESLGKLGKNYEFALGSVGRIAGRPAQAVRIKPRDGFRYGYVLWADQESGLLLKAELIDREENPLEQFLFTQVRIGHDIGDDELRPSQSAGPMEWVTKTSPSSEKGPAAGRLYWRATELPRGFRLASHLSRDMPSRENLEEHLVYTDGLAAVSVFIERIVEGHATMMEGGSRMGAVHAFGRRADSHQITAVGEVPAATVNLIATSVVRQK